MVQHLWGVTIETRTNLLLPRMRHVYGSSVMPPYHWAGRDRKERFTLFQYTLSGYGCFSDDSGEMRLYEGDGFLVNHADPAYEYYYPGKANAPWEVLWCVFEGDGVHDAVQAINRQYGYVFSLPKTSPAIRTLLRFNDGTIRTTALTASDSARLVSGLLYDLIGTREHREKSTPSSDIIERARTLLGDTGKLYTASSLAQSLSISREHLSRVFRTELDMSPYEYIIKQKMDLAKIDVRYGSDSFIVIARRYGFSSPAQFASLFKRATGLSPRTYRRGS
ncbi:MAG: helix-turn-helix domain-containing protein [Spirochaetes bacterium]|nr:helix-turn-helix domain-containing protein [Spirochaetota bacterium]